MLTNLLSAHDPILTLTIRNHFTTKLLPALAMLHEMKGILESFIPPKQGGKGANQPKVTVKIEPKGNQASGSGDKDKRWV